MKMSGNIAKIYGNDIGSVPAKIVYITAKQYDAQKLRADP